MKKEKYLPYEEARKFVHSLGLKSQKEWRVYCKSGSNPNNIPNDPYSKYKNNGFISWGEFLGTYRIAEQLRLFLPFEEARAFVQKLNLKSQKEWKEYCKSGNKPNNIPSNPYETYEGNWISLGDFLGTDIVATQNKTYLSFDKARTFVHTLNLKSRKEWDEYCKSGNKPDNIPNDPYSKYGKTQLFSMGDFLGTGNIHKKAFLSYEEARTFVHTLNLKSGKEWDEYCKSGNKPDNIPSNPYQTYGKTHLFSMGGVLRNRNNSNSK